MPRDMDRIMESNESFVWGLTMDLLSMELCWMPTEATVHSVLGRPSLKLSPVAQRYNLVVPRGNLNVKDAFLVHWGT
uniref:Uncharacterized protein n=1 Tax=Anguilla anguilla TaxID=7936 RepID=A0A0E9T2E9_ANGAN